MAANFRLVVHAAEAHPHELAFHRPRDRLAERGLADAGRPDEAQNRSFALRRELAHREVLDDAALDLLEAVVILVENAPRLGNVDRALLGQRPRQFDQPVEIGADHAVFAGRLRHALEPAQFLARLVLDLLRHPGLGDRLVELGDFGGLALFALAKLALDRSHLLAQQRFALTFVERRLGLLADLGGEPQHLDAMGEKPRDLVHPRRDVDGLENLLLFARTHVHVGDGEIGERPRRVGRFNGGHQLAWRLRQKAQGFQRLTAQVQEPRFDFRRTRFRFRHADDARHHEGPAAQEFDDLEALLALADHVIGAVRRRDVARDIRDRSHAVHVDRRRIVGLWVALHQDADFALLAHGLLGRRDRARATDRDRHDGPGKQHEVAHRDDDHGIGRQRAQHGRLRGVAGRAGGRRTLFE